MVTNFLLGRKHQRCVLGLASSREECCRPKWGAQGTLCQSWKEKQMFLLCPVNCPMGKPFSDVGREIRDQKGGRLSNNLGPTGIFLRNVGHLIGLSRSSNPTQHTCSQALHSRDVIPKPAMTEWLRMLSPGLDLATLETRLKVSSPTSVTGYDLRALLHHHVPSVLS